MINIVIDNGNTRIKAGVFDSSSLQESHQFSETNELAAFLAQPHDNIIVSSVKNLASDLIQFSGAHIKLKLSQATPLPIQIKYATPQTLGVDRIAAACGALQLFPDQDCLVIDLGTCINYEFLDQDKNYWGGVISPGMLMRFNSMHTFTAQLPLAEATHNPDLIGNSTISCLQSGVMNGMLEEMEGIVRRMKSKYPELRVILSGGDSHFFEKQMKPSIFAAPELVLNGLNRILMHNVSI